MIGFTKKIAFLFVLSFSSLAFASDGAWLTNIKPIDDAFFIQAPADGPAAVVSVINQARTSIKMMMYHLSNPDVVNALIAAKKRGIDVVLILDQKSISSGKYQDFATQLQNSGVTVVRSSSGFSISHVKAMVIDGTMAFISTMNLVGAWQQMRDYGIFTTDAGIIAEFNSVFATDLQNAQNGGNLTPPLSNPNLVWSPINSEAKLVDLINASRKTVQVTVENLGNPRFQAALVNAVRRGVQVVTETPECIFGDQGNRNDEFIRGLISVGARSRLMPMPNTVALPYMHAKSIVVDGYVAFLGSENFSVNSLNYARELGIVFMQPQSVQKLNAVFAQDWSVSKDFTSYASNHCDSKRTFGSSIFPSLFDLAKSAY